MKLDSVPIRLERCAKTFPGAARPVLKPLDLDIAAGETVVLLGPSGCGKTTTLRLIAGLERPDAGGRVFFGAEDVSARPIEERQVGMVFQNYALFPHMNVRQNVAYGLSIRRLPPQQIARRVDELLALTRLDALAERQIAQLSGGQRQRVALARALAPQPRVLLLDEPLTALDAQLRESLRTEMNTLLRNLGVTTVYVTHDQAEAMALGDKIVVMSAGAIEQIGTPRDIYHQPANAVVASFIGTMNQLEGVWRDGALHCAGGRLIAAPGAQPRSRLWFRPEDVILTPSGGELHGVVESATFLGGHTRLSLSGVGAAPILVDAPGRTRYATGERIGFSLAAEVWHTPLPDTETTTC
ncbi:ABC transporter ATP-binding protein [Paludibacterium yongneupense]|uniref:ABC transporter ATP-binding protein n=1 Tax=Paludibacterium yongneupense TaxID=400061 RepID=UPI00040895DA|nr:ABC transporter ATP-binding protein [Paludibacterium yongneupense]